MKFDMDRELSLRLEMAEAALGQEAKGWWGEHEPGCDTEDFDECSCYAVFWFTGSRSVARVDYELASQLFPLS